MRGRRPRMEPSVPRDGRSMDGHKTTPIQTQPRPCPLLWLQPWLPVPALASSTCKLSEIWGGDVCQVAPRDLRIWLEQSGSLLLGKAQPWPLSTEYNLLQTALGDAAHRGLDKSSRRAGVTQRDRPGRKKNGSYDIKSHKTAWLALEEPKDPHKRHIFKQSQGKTVPLQTDLNEMSSSRAKSLVFNVPTTTQFPFMDSDHPSEAG